MNRRRRIISIARRKVIEKFILVTIIEIFFFDEKIIKMYRSFKRRESMNNFNFSIEKVSYKRINKSYETQNTRNPFINSSLFSFDDISFRRYARIYATSVFTFFLSYIASAYIGQAGSQVYAFVRFGSLVAFRCRLLRSC